MGLWAWTDVKAGYRDARIGGGICGANDYRLGWVVGKIVGMR